MVEYTILNQPYNVGTLEYPMDYVYNYYFMVILYPIMNEPYCERHIRRVSLYVDICIRMRKCWEYHGDQ